MLNKLPRPYLHFSKVRLSRRLSWFLCVWKDISLLTVLSQLVPALSLGMIQTGYVTHVIIKTLLLFKSIGLIILIFVDLSPSLSNM